MGLRLFIMPTPKNYAVLFRRKLASYMDAHVQSPEQMKRIIGVDASTIRRWLKGDSAPSAGKLREICQTLNWNYDVFVDDAKTAEIIPAWLALERIHNDYKLAYNMQEPHQMVEAGCLAALHVMKFFRAGKVELSLHSPLVPEVILAVLYRETPEKHGLNVRMLGFESGIHISAGISTPKDGGTSLTGPVDTIELAPPLLLTDIAIQTTLECVQNYLTHESKFTTDGRSPAAPSGAAGGAEASPA